MKTIKLFLTYNGPDDSIILWDETKKEVLFSWETDTPLKEILSDIETNYREQGKLFKIYLILNFEILKDLNLEWSKEKNHG